MSGQENVILECVLQALPEGISRFVYQIAR